KEIETESKPLVLVVDDDETHQRLMGLLADSLNIAVHIAPTCHQALKSLEMFTFDIILMDFRMPEVDGCSCTKRIRSLGDQRSRVPIIAITAHVSEESRAKCLEAGMDDFLAKPFTLSELQDKLRHWLARRPE
ncbi:MAG TPA: response regulator, partial [Nitrososphaera sp.]|nr:response regulator [Nitrososphaera sp.]